MTIPSNKGLVDTGEEGHRHVFAACGNEENNQRLTNPSGLVSGRAMGLKIDTVLSKQPGLTDNKGRHIESCRKRPKKRVNVTTHF